MTEQVEDVPANELTPEAVQIAKKIADIPAEVVEVTPEPEVTSDPTSDPDEAPQGKNPFQAPKWAIRT